MWGGGRQEGGNSRYENQGDEKQDTISDRLYFIIRHIIRATGLDSVHINTLQHIFSKFIALDKNPVCSQICCIALRVWQTSKGFGIFCSVNHLIGGGGIQITTQRARPA